MHSTPKQNIFQIAGISLTAITIAFYTANSIALPLYSKIEIGQTFPKKFKNTFSYNDRESYIKNLDGAQPKHVLQPGLEIGIIPNKNIKLGLNASILKLNFKKSFPSLEGDSLYQNANLKTRSNIFMLNGYYYPFDSKPINPYLIIGAGLAKHNFLEYNHHQTYGDMLLKRGGKSTYAFAWNVGIGGEIKAYKNIFFDVSAKYFDYGKGAVSNTSSAFQGGKFIESSEDYPKGTRIKGVNVSLGIVFKI